MAGRLIPIRIGEVEVLVEVTSLPGSEPTSGIDKASERVANAYQKAQATILEVAASTVDTLGRLAKRSARPDQIEVEFGLKFAANGNVIVAGASADATLIVRLSYTTASHTPGTADTASRTNA
jgi:Trypsin-co-occurring domain 1